MAIAYSGHFESVCLLNMWNWRWKGKRPKSPDWPLCMASLVYQAWSSHWTVGIIAVIGHYWRTIFVRHFATTVSFRKFHFARDRPIAGFSFGTKTFIRAFDDFRISDNEQTRNSRWLWWKWPSAASNRCVTCIVVLQCFKACMKFFEQWSDLTRVFFQWVVYDDTHSAA